MTNNEIRFRLALDGATQVKAGADSVAASLGQVGRTARQTAADANQLPGIFGATSDSLRQMAQVAAGGTLAVGFVRAADAVTVLNNQLKLATGSAQAAGVAYGALFDIAQRSRTSFTELGATYASIARATSELGISQTRLLTVTEAIGNSLAISGGNAQGMQAALTQLGQGFASGTLRGEELNSVLEQTPRLARAIADGMGVSIGKLRELGKDGKLTAEAVLGALESQAAVLAKEVQSSVVTVGQALTQLGNASTKAVGDVDRVTGSSEALAKAFQSAAGGVQLLADAIVQNESAFKILLGGIAGVAAVSAVGALGGALATVGTRIAALGATLAANPAVLALLGLGAVGGAAVSAGQAYSKTAGGIEDAIKALELANQQSEAALARAAAGGRTAGVNNINRVITERTEQIRLLRAELDKLRGVDANADISYLAGLPEGMAKVAKAAAITKDQLRELAAEQAKQQTVMNAMLGVTDGYVESLKRLNAMRQAGRLTEAEYLTQVEKLIALQPSSIALAKKQAEEQKKFTDTLADGAKAYAQYVADLERSAVSAEDQLQRLVDEERAAGLAAAGNISLAEAIQRVAIERLREQQVIVMADGAAVAAIQREIETRERLIGVMRSKATREANADADADALKQQAESAKRAADDWQRTADDIRGSLTDAFRTAFESGESFGTAMAKVIQRELKARIATALSGLLAEGVMAAFGLGDYRAGGSNGVAGGSGSLWQSASTASSLYNTGNTAYGWYSGAGSAANTYGQYMAGYQGSSAMMGAGTVGPVTNGAAGATGAGASTASAMSTIGPYAIAAIAYAIGADQMADWSLHLGGYSEARRGGVRNIASEIPGSSELSPEIIAGMAAQGVYIPSVQQLSDGMAAALFGFADKFAASVKATSPVEATQVVFESDRANDSWGQVKFLGAGNRELSSTGMLTDLNWDANVAAPQLVTRSAAAFAAAMQDSDAAVWVKQSLAAIPAELERITPDIAKQFEDPLQQAQAVNQALAGMLDNISATFGQLDNLDEQLGALGGAFGQLSAMSSDARNALVLAVGGMDQFQAQASAYVGNFYSDAEKTALTLDAVGRSLGEVGLSLPATRDGFRALVDAQDLSTDAGRKAYAALMGTADAFASVTVSARSATDILQERAGLESELLTLQGNTAALRARERDQLDASNRALYDQVRALEDQQAAARAAADVLQERAGLEAELLTLQGNTAALRERERDLLDASNRALYDQVKALQDQQAAAESARQAADEAARAAADAADAAARLAAEQAERVTSVFGGLTNALLQGVSDAYNQAASAIQTERQRTEQQAEQSLRALEQQADRVTQVYTGMLDALADAAQQVRDQLAGDDGRAQAVGTLQQALADLQGGRSVDADALRSAAGTAARLDTAGFATSLDYQRALSGTGNLLREVSAAVKRQQTTELGTIAAQQVKVEAELAKQLEVLDDQLDQAKSAAGSLVNIDRGVQSVADAMRQLYAAIAAANVSAGNVAAGPTGQWLRSGNTEVFGDPGGASATRTVGADVQDTVIRGKTGDTYSVQQARDFVNDRLAAGDITSVYQSAAEQGINSNSLDLLMAWTPGTAMTAVFGPASGMDAVIRGKSGASFSLAQIRAFVNDRLAAGDVESIYYSAIEQGIDSNGLDALMGWDPGTSLAEALRRKLPAFAAGTSYVPQTGPALVHQGERILTATDNAALMQMMAGGGSAADVAALLRTLIAQVAALQAANTAENHAIASYTGKAAALLDDVINGGATVNTLAAA